MKRHTPQTAAACSRYPLTMAVSNWGDELRGRAPANAPELPVFVMLSGSVPVIRWPNSEGFNLRAQARPYHRSHREEVNGIVTLLRTGHPEPLGGTVYTGGWWPLHGDLAEQMRDELVRARLESPFAWRAHHEPIPQALLDCSRAMLIDMAREPVVHADRQVTALSTWTDSNGVLQAATQQLLAQASFTLAQLEVILAVKAGDLVAEGALERLQEVALEYGIMEFHDARPSAYHSVPGFDPIRALAEVAGEPLPPQYTRLRSLDAMLIATQQYEAWDRLRVDVLERVGATPEDLARSPFVQRLREPTLAIERQVELLLGEVRLPEDAPQASIDPCASY